MPPRPDVTRADSRRRHPLPDREGILSPGSGRTRFEYAFLDRDPVRHCVGADGRPPLQTRVHPRLRRGIAGGNYLRMENRHPAACFARRPELKPFQSAGGLLVVWHRIVRDGYNPPQPLPLREGKNRPVVSARMLGPYRIIGSGTGK
jgi:hypothetical protein